MSIHAGLNLFRKTGLTEMAAGFRRRFGSPMVIAFILIIFSTGGLAAEFVKTSGTTFTLAGRPFFITGVNNHYLPHASETEITKVLDDAVALGTPVLRLYLEPVIGSPDGSVPTIWDWQSTANSDDLGTKGHYLLYWDDKAKKMAINEGPDGIEKVDFIIAEAQKRDIKLILAFLDFWDYTGGAQQIRSWYGSADKYTFFFEDPRTKRDYKQWVDYVVNRLNPKTKLHYRDDPTIMAWELMNEPNAKPMELRQEWTAEMSAYVKKLDSNHLVGTGHANADWHHFDINTDLAVDTVDYGTWHGYPKYFQITADQMNNLIPHYCAFGEAFHKPVLFEEFGYARSHPDQAEVYRKWLDTLVGDRNCAGWAVWRLVSRQDDGSFPADEVDQFDIRNDGSKIWQVLQMETKKGIGHDD